MIDAYLEGGMVLVVAILFCGQMVFLQKTLMSKLGEIEDIVIKLIDKHNKSDSDTFRKLDSMIDSAERRHDILIKEVDDLSDSVAFVKGRLNGRSG